MLVPQKRAGAPSAKTKRSPRMVSGPWRPAGASSQALASITLAPKSSRGSKANQPAGVVSPTAGVPAAGAPRAVSARAAGVSRP
jgi:hypothetical protein